MPPAPTRRRLFALLTVLLVGLVVEGSALAVFKLKPGFVRARVYERPDWDERRIKAMLKDRDERLGWPGKRWLAQNAAFDGSRRSPANQGMRDAPACVSIYGDSFAYGFEVNDREAWSNQVAERLGCPVTNFAVPGYGVDQAVLRAEGNRSDLAELTVLAIYPHNLLRNRNQWHYLICPSCLRQELAVKPRFRLERDGGLSLVPLPVSSEQDMRQLIANPAAVLRDEDLLPDGRHRQAPLRIGFPYSVALGRVLKDALADLPDERTGSVQATWSLPLWYDTPEGLEPYTIALNTAIVRRFAESKRCQERRCAVLIIPDAHGFVTWSETGRDITAPIAEPLRDILPVWTPLEEMGRAMAERGVCFHIGRQRDCRGHFNVDGYSLLAHFVTRQVREKRSRR